VYCSVSRGPGNFRSDGKLLQTPLLRIGSERLHSGRVRARGHVLGQLAAGFEQACVAVGTQAMLESVVLHRLNRPSFRGGPVA
jgi:hypothetical protein